MADTSGPISQRPTIHGDPSRALTVALPPTYRSLYDLVLSSFAMKPPLSLYRDGKELIDGDNYDTLQSGDQLICVDGGGRSVNLKDLFISTYDQDYGPKPLPPREVTGPPMEYSPLKDNRDFTTTNDDFKKWPIAAREKAEPIPSPRALPFRGTTESQDQYRGVPLAPREAVIREPYQRPNIRFDATTTNQADYKAWPIPKRAAAEPSRPTKTLPFTATTSNHDDYRAYKLEPAAGAEKVEWRPNPSKFNGHTTNQDDYKAWPIAKREVGVPVERPKSIPFTARSSNQDDYKAYDISRGPRGEPIPSYTPLRDNRDFSTSNGDFKAWPISKREVGVPVERPKSIPFTARSSNQDDYKAYDIAPAPPPPPVQYEGPKLPFTARTSNQDDYKKWPIARKIYVNIVPANDAFLTPEGQPVGDFLEKRRSIAA